MSTYSGTLILVIGSSGSGKSELMAALQKAHPEYVYPISATTRAPRENESEGVKYHFLSDEAFDRAIERGEFLEWAHFGGRRYGTLKSEILNPIRDGKLAVREVEVQGARRILELLPRENVHIIFIDGGDWDTLVARINRRAQMSEEELAKRKARFDDEQRFKEQADTVIVNEEGEMERAVETFLYTVEHIHQAL